MNTDTYKTMMDNARAARAAIRHALQFLEDPTHHGDGHLTECIENCKAVLLTDRRNNILAEPEQVEKLVKVINADTGLVLEMPEKYAHSGWMPPQRWVAYRGITAPGNHVPPEELDTVRLAYRLDLSVCWLP